MTISSSVSTVTRNGNGATTSFPFPFKVWDTDQLKVFIRNPAGEATETTNWTATLADPDPGGSVVYPAVGGTVLPTGWKIVINRNMPLTQEADYVNATPFLAETVETALDQLTASVQQLKEATDRAVQIDPGSTDPGAYLTEIRAAVVSTAADAVSCAEDAVTAAAAAAIVTANQTNLNNVTNNLTAIQNAATNAATATTQAGIATTKAGEAETARAAAVVAQGLAEDAQAAAEAAATNVGNYKHFTTGTVGQTVITLPWSYDVSAGNIFLIIGGVPQMPDAYTLTDSTHITLDDPLAGGETIAVYSIPTPAGPSVPLYVANNLSDLTDASAARGNLGLGTAALVNTGSNAGNVPLLDASAALTLPSQPAFLATLTADLLNVTGAGNYTVVCDNEVFDRGSNYNTGTGIFTAPVTGIYRFDFYVFCSGLLNTHTSADTRIVCSNRTLRGALQSGYALANNNGKLIMGFSSLVDMDAGDTAYPQVAVDNGTAVVDVEAASSTTRFSGHLVC